MSLSVKAQDAEAPKAKKQDVDSDIPF
jgi:hypothetical protein